jgi:hypothetical protein
MYPAFLNATSLCLGRSSATSNERILREKIRHAFSHTLLEVIQFFLGYPTDANRLPYQLLLPGIDEVNVECALCVLRHVRVGAIAVAAPGTVVGAAIAIVSAHRLHRR